MMETLRTFFDRLSNLTLSVEDIRERGLNYWRERIFAITISAMLLLGFIALVPSVWLSFSSGLIALGIFDIFAYLLVLSMLVYGRQIRYEYRAAILVGLGFAVGLVVFFVTAGEGAGLLWLFMVPPMASILLGLQWGFGFFMLNFVFMNVIGYFVVLDSPFLPRLQEFTISGWLVYGVNFIVTNALITFPLGALLNGLFYGAEREKKLVADYRILFDSNPLPMWVYDLMTLKFLAVNDAAVSHYGYSRAEFADMTLRDIRPVEDIWILENNIATSSGEKQQSGPWHHKTKGGQIIDVEIYSHSLDFGGIPARLVLIQDVTERLKAEEKLQLSDQILQRVHSLVLVMKADGEIIYVSPSSAPMLGYEPEELLGDGWWQKTRATSQDTETEKNALKWIATGKIPISNKPYERPIRTKTGDVRWIEWQDAMGTNETLIGVGRDITDRKEIERELRRNLAKLDESIRFNDTIISSSPIGILAYDVESGQCVIANEAAATLTGATKEQLLSQNYHQIPSWKISGLYENAKEVVNSGSMQQIDSQFVTSFGKQVHFQTTMSIFLLEKREHLLVTISDISELKKNERALQQRLAELEAIHDVSVNLRAALTLDEILPLLLDSTLAALGCSSGGIWLLDSADGFLKPVESRFRSPQGEDIAVKPEKPGSGLAGRVFLSGEPFYTKEYASDEQVDIQLRKQIPAGIGGIDVPIWSENDIVGVLTVNTFLPREVELNEVELVVTLSEIAGNAIRRSRLHEQTQHQLELFRSLNEIDRIILSSFDLVFNLQMLTARTVEQLQVDASNILIYDPLTQVLTSNEGTGFTTAAFQGRQVALGDGFAGKAAAERKMLRVDNLLSEETNPRLARALAGERFIAYLAVPLIAKGELRGVMEIFHSKPLPRDEDWIGKVDTLAGRAAIAIDTLKVFDNLERTNKELLLSYDAAIEGWSRALDLRDKETEGHSQRVTELAVNLARSMGVKGKDLVNLSRGALLHDIGKMGVPDSILRKEGPLTEDEWVSMRKHPTYAREMLESIGYLQEAIDVPYGHHERWDGSGYPRGLRGEQIPLVARIFAVADVYDALTSDRPYRKAWSRKDTIEYIREQSGKIFDPKVVEAFLALQSVESPLGQVSRG